MPSPFPGMDPYLERADVWRDVHKRLVCGLAEEIGRQVQPDHLVKIAPRGDGARAGESFVEIRDRRSRELVCLVKLLGPANKRPGPDRAQYLAKRTTVLGGSAHLVEIDLLIGGQAMPASDRPACVDSIMVSRAEDRPSAGFWPVGLREALPVVPIPLRSPRADARLDLKPLIHRVHDAAGYRYYAYESPPPLAGEDPAWAVTTIRREAFEGG